MEDIEEEFLGYVYTAQKLKLKEIALAILSLRLKEKVIYFTADELYEKARLGSKAHLLRKLNRLYEMDLLYRSTRGHPIVWELNHNWVWLVKIKDLETGLVICAKNSHATCSYAKSFSYMSFDAIPKQVQKEFSMELSALCPLSWCNLPIYYTGTLLRVPLAAKEDELVETLKDAFTEQFINDIQLAPGKKLEDLGYILIKRQ